jgi:type II secretory pathway pseudopilin PulG
VVIILIAILYSIAVPTHERLLEKNRAEAANFNLLSIYNAEKRYKLDNAAGQYFTCGATCTSAVMDNNLGVYINDNNFTYGIVPDAANGFRATATRLGGNLCNGKTMVVVGTNSNVTKGCQAW